MSERLVLGVIFLLAYCPMAFAAKTDAKSLLIKLQHLLRAETNVARYQMRIHTPEWERSITLQSWDDRPGKRFFIRILSPKKDRGTAFLKVGGNLWMYLPKLERDIRIPPSMMLDSWMGSDFTNDDLVKMSSVVEDYDHRILAEDEGGYLIESIPHPDAPVVWGKLIHRIDKEGLPVFEEFYNERGEKMRRLEFRDPAVMDGRKIPTRWILYPLRKPGCWTELRLQSIAFNVSIPEEVFTRRNLHRRTF